jgi:hypothetical protein
VTMSSDAEGFAQTGHEYPLGGVAYPQTAEPNEPLDSWRAFPGGYIPLKKYLPARIGDRKDIDADAESFVNFMTFFRKPVSQEIRRKRNDIEARILKLCDLREQLVTERDTILVQAFGGLSSGMTEFDPERFAQVLRVPRIAQAIDELFFLVQEDGSIDFTTTNTSELAKYVNLLDDILPDEANTAL